MSTPAILPTGIVTLSKRKLRDLVSSPEDVHAVRF